MKRLLVDIIFFFLAFLAPWWLTLLLGAAACFYFSSWYEILALGVIIDSLYNAPVDRLYHIQGIATILAFLIFILAHEMKGKLRFYAD